MGQGMVAQSWHYPGLWYETNIAKKAELLNNCLKLDSLEKYIRASTPEVYGSNKNFLKECVSLVTEINLLFSFETNILLFPLIRY